MKNIRVLITSVVLGLLLTPTFALAQTGGMKLGGNSIKFDKAKFDAKVKSDFEGKVTGYQIILLKKGQIVSELAGGYSRNAVDGNVKMTVNSPSNIGSTAKFFAGTALMKLFASPKGYLNPTGRSVDGWLDLEIFPYLPEIWKNNAHASWKKVTFRQLIKHTSGVRGLTQADKDAAKAKGFRDSPFNYFLKEIKPENRGVWDYENFNFTILTYLIPVIADPTLRATLNMEVTKKNLKADDLYITQRFGNAFEAYLRGKMFEKITPKIYPSCDAPNDYPKQNKSYAMGYNIWNDIGKGFEWSEKVQNGSCYAQGGWYLSSRELAAFVANFSATETIVPNAVREMMFDDKTGNRLVWSNASGDDFVKEKFGMNFMPWMGGAQGGYYATIVMLADNYYAVGMINSAITPVKQGADYGGSGELTRNIMNAFDAGVADNFK